MKKVLLYSGGTDSWLIDKLWKPDLRLYVDINSRYTIQELDRLPSDVKVVPFHTLGHFEQPDTAYVPFRNLFFITIAAQYGDEICLGAVDGDQGSKDKTPEFFQ